jgi:diaminopimelate epimerase
MRVINADGSIPEMCGNGIRCVALHLARTGRAPTPMLTIETDAGPHVCALDAANESNLVTVTMRSPSLVPGEIPVRGTAPLVDTTIDVAGRSLRGTAVSMGNPHFVTFDDVGESRLELGPRVGRDPRFPEGVNVGFARVDGPSAITLHVFERDAGWTRACGTGACAAAVAAVETGRAERNTPITVRLPGGTLTIVVGAPGEPVRMRGPARHVFDGETRRPNG